MTDNSADELIDVRETATLLGVSPRQVRRYRKAGQLTGQEQTRTIAPPQEQPALVFRRGDVLKLKEEREGTKAEDV